jgi:hypothetical protein
MAKFKKNKYTKWYYNIIEAAKNRIKASDEYYEKHHIMPVSLGGKRNVKNEVYLTAREHFLCHFLLTRMTSGKARTKMTYAFHIMKSNPRGNGKRYNGRLFEMTRKELSIATSGKNSPTYGLKLCGEKNGFFGKHHTEKTKDLLRSKLKGKMAGSDNPFYGKRHTEETKKFLSKQQGDSIVVVFLDGSRKKLDTKRSLGTYLGKSPELGAKLMAPKYRYLWEKYNIKDIHEDRKSSQD